MRPIIKVAENRFFDMSTGLIYEYEQLTEEVESVLLAGYPNDIRLNAIASGEVADKIITYIKHIAANM
jgi:hypothetical protein